MVTELGADDTIIVEHRMVAVDKTIELDDRMIAIPNHYVN